LALITVFFALQLPKVQIDNNTVNFLPKDNPIRVMSDYVDDTFGGSLSLMVGLERPYGTVFDTEFLTTLKRFTNDIEAIPLVDEVNSLITMDYITSDDEGIVIKDLVDEDFTGTVEEIAELKRRVSSWNVLRGALVSDDLSATMVTITFPLPVMAVGEPEVVAALKEIRAAAKGFDGQAEVYFTGLPVVMADMTAAMMGDLVLLIPLVIIVVLGVLFFSFRRISGIVLPLLTVLVAVIWTLGLMPLFGVKMSVISTLLPILLIAVGSAYGIHVVTHYFHDAGNRLLSGEEHRGIVLDLMRKIVKPVFLAALTTFAGFISFCFTSLTPMRDLGIFASIGVIFSFVVAVTLVPSLLLVRGPRPALKLKNRASGEDPLSGAIGDAFYAVARKKRFVLIAAAMVVAFSFSGLSKVVIDNVMMEYFNPKADIARSDKFISEKFTGSTAVDIIIEAGSSELLLAPDVLGPLDSLNTYLTGRVPEVGMAMGFTDMVKRINQVFNADEDPRGLQAGTVTAMGGAGDGDFADFGFDSFDSDGDFGFDNGITGDYAEIPALPLPESRETLAERLQNYSVLELLVMLDTAAGNTGAMSGTELVRDFERQVNYEGLAYYEMPTDPARYGKTSPQELQQLVSNYLVLLAGGLDQYANDSMEPTAIRSSVMLRSASGIDIKKVENIINAFVAANFPDTVKVSLSGGGIVQNALSNNIVNSQIISLAAAIIMVFIIMAISNRSLIAGLIGSLPLALTILINFAIMGFAGIKLNMGTAMIASLTVGIGVDYTIHYMEAFKREFRALNGGGDFLRRTFTNSGKAILINAVSVGGGFLVLIFSNLNFLGEMGLLIALTMGISALLSLTLIPALITVIKPKFVYKGV
jgi:predicted RND superfamily exporter protein